MAYIEKQSVRVPDTGIPEVIINSVDNGWVVRAGRGTEGFSMDRVVAAFESFASLAAWLEKNIENNTAKHQ